MNYGLLLVGSGGCGGGGPHRQGLGPADVDELLGVEKHKLQEIVSMKDSTAQLCSQVGNEIGGGPPLACNGPPALGQAQALMSKHEKVV